MIAEAGMRRTVLLSTHQTEDVAMLCHRVIVMVAAVSASRAPRPS